MQNRSFVVSYPQRGIWSGLSKPNTPLEDTNRSASDQIYTELAHGEIRIVKLLPAATWTDEIVCSLQTIKIDSETRQDYEALSYTWGSAENPSTMILNGQRYSITQNLEAALRQLRDTKHARDLWIDALAINQSSSPEKSRQVRIMPSIYSSARQTIVWLGPSDIQRSAIPIMFTFANVFGTLGGSETRSVFKQLPKDRIIRLLFKFSQLPYWSRAWVFQESVRSKSVIIQSGKETMTFDAFAGIWKVLQSIIHEHIEHSVDTEEAMLTTLMGQNLSAFPIDQLQPGGRQSTTTWDFDSWFENFALQRKCQDLRDKVFAAHSMFPEQVAKQIPVDYSLSIDDVFTNATRAFMSVEGPWSILDQVDEIGHAPEYAAETPSWVPDLLQNDRGNEIDNKMSRLSWKTIRQWKLDRQEHIRRCRSLGSFYIEPDGRSLQVSAYKIGTCSKMALPFRASSIVQATVQQDAPRDYVFHNLDRVAAHYKHCKEQLAVLPAQDESFAYAFAGPMDLGPVHLEFVKMVLELWQYDGVSAAEIFNQKKARDDVVLFQSLFAIHMRRVMFSMVPSPDFDAQDATPVGSREANLGIAIDEMQQGDELYIVPGSDQPFVLRPFNGKHIFVGLAFIGRLRNSGWLWDRIESRTINMEVVSIV